MKNFAFVFARGGSKGLPRKNIKKLSGKPLIEYSISVALDAPSIDGVFVSTEDVEIAAISSGLGAVVIERPQELASDECPEWVAWQHAIEWVKSNYGVFKYFVSLPATSPLRNISDVENAIHQVEKTRADICISVTPANNNPYFNMVKQLPDQLVGLVNNPDDSVVRRQDAPEIFDVTTVVYAADPEFIMNSSGIFSGSVTSIVVPKNRAVDIDDIYDFKLAELIMNESLDAER